MKNSPLGVVIAGVSFCASLLLFAPAIAAPSSDGLILSFDASEQARLRATNGVPALGRFQPVDLVIDSARGETAFQSAPERRPILVGDENAAFFRFDGKD